MTGTSESPFKRAADCTEKVEQKQQLSVLDHNAMRTGTVQ